MTTKWLRPSSSIMESTHLTSHQWFKLKQSLIPYPSSLISYESPLTTPMIILTGNDTVDAAAAVAAGQDPGWRALTWYPAVPITDDDATVTSTQRSSSSVKSTYEWSSSASAMMSVPFISSICRASPSWNRYLQAPLHYNKSIEKGEMTVNDRMAYQIGCSGSQFRDLVISAQQKLLFDLLECRVLDSIMIDNGQAMVIAYHAGSGYMSPHLSRLILWRLPRRNHVDIIGHPWPHLEDSLSSSSSSSLTISSAAAPPLSSSSRGAGRAAVGSVPMDRSLKASQWCGTIQWNCKLSSFDSSNGMRIINNQLIIVCNVNDSSASSFLVQRLSDGADIELSLIPLPPNFGHNRFLHGVYEMYFDNGTIDCGSESGNDDIKVICTNHLNVLVYRMSDILKASPKAANPPPSLGSTWCVRPIAIHPLREPSSFYKLERYLVGGNHWLVHEEHEWYISDLQGRCLHR
jgi:chemotaxis signal transduction protein